MSDDRPPRYVYLASASPRRRDLLEQMGIPHVLLAPDPTEDAEALEVRLGAESPRTYVRRVARLKADAALRRVLARGLPPAPVLAGDTTVALGRRILGKPEDADDARDMLRSLSGRTHLVLSAIVVTDGRHRDDALSQSRVRFRRLAEDDIERYVTSDEPFGKAGAYAIQGRGAAFVARISGSHSGIVGLPLFETVALLARFGVVPG